MAETSNTGVAEGLTNKFEVESLYIYIYIKVFTETCPGIKFNYLVQWLLSYLSEKEEEDKMGNFTFGALLLRYCV